MIRTKKKIPLHRIVACIVLFLLSRSVTGCAIAPKSPFLRDYALKKNVLTGAAVRPDKLDEPEYARTVAQEFDMVVPENHLKWSYVHPEKDRYDFRGADKIVKFAVKNNMKIRGHALVWHKSIPEWLASARDHSGDVKVNFSKEELESILKEHIKTVVKRYKGKIEYWDVVNEVFMSCSDCTELRRNFWYTMMGKEYIEKAFLWAHEADQNAKLFINENKIGMKNPKSDALYALVKELKAKGIPIDGVGFQFHLDSGERLDFQNIETNIKRFIDLGLEIQFTEIDVAICGEITEEKLKLQSEIYQGIMEIALKYPQITAFVTWGVTDKYSWLPWFYGEVLNDKTACGSGLLFDENYRKKPAYYAIIGALRKDEY